MYAFPLARSAKEKMRFYGMHAETRLWNQGIRWSSLGIFIVFASSRSVYGQQARGKVAHRAAFPCAGKVYPRAETRSGKWSHINALDQNDFSAPGNAHMQSRP